MGGNALSKSSVRLTKKNYEHVSEVVCAKLRETFPKNRVAPIVAYRAKADFGDLDVLVESNGYDPFVAAEALGATEVVRNGPVTSIGVLVPAELRQSPGAVFQVDLIKSAAQEFDYTSGYFAYNDLGNLIGRTAHRAGLAHRHDGLFYYHRDGDYMFEELLLTRDHDRALEFLGYSAKRFGEGFEGLEDIFKYVATSKFFNRDIFLLENRNARARVRDSKRRTYMLFLEWCEKHPELPAFQYPAEKTAWLPRIREHFSHFGAEFERSQRDLAKQRQLKAISNGARVSLITGLQGKELGVVMKSFRESFASREEEAEFLLSASDQAYEQRVRSVQTALGL